MWEKDKLERKKYADFLYTLIQNSDRYQRAEEENAYVIALDSPWGTGKTYFLKLFEEYLREEKELLVIHYSAWENDFWDNAFLPLLYALYGEDALSVKAGLEEGKKYAKDILHLAAYLGREMGFKKLETLVGDKGVEILRSGMEHVEEYQSEALNVVFQDYEAFKKAYEKIREMLASCIKKKSDQKAVIVIDELDRCRPDFAVQTLEVVKHLFNVKGLVFVFAVDMEQLGCVIRGIYGESLDARTYLNRMFHYVTHLPEPEPGKYFQALFEEKTGNFLEYHRSSGHIRKMTEWADCLIRGFDLSLRELDTVWKSYLVLYDYKLRAYRLTEAHMLYFLFLVMKYRLPDLKKYLTEKGFTRLADMKELGLCQEYLTEDSLLKETLNQPARRPLKELQGMLYSSQFGAIGRREIQIGSVEERTIYFEEDLRECQVSIEENTVFAGILYEPDFEVWKRIREMSLAEYMREQLEMFDFSGE